jgi:hypothetical protein
MTVNRQPKMIEHRELISICRQIGSMMEAGVDILRVTRVLRAQTDNPLILKAYDSLDHDLRMGQSLADAMEQVPEMFSPFAASLVRQGEARNDIAGAFFKIADFLQKEDEVAVTHQNDHTMAAGEGASTAATPVNRFAVMAPSALLPVWVIDDLLNRLQVAALRLFTVIAGLLLTLAAVWGSVEAGWVERRWQNVVVYSVSALFIGGSGVWLRRRIENDRNRELDRRRFMEEEAGHVLDESASARSEAGASSTTTVSSAPAVSSTPTISASAAPPPALSVKPPANAANGSHEATFE